MDTKEAIKKIADVLQNYGWVQNHIDGPRGCCLIGAVHKLRLEPGLENLCINELYARCGVPMLEGPIPESSFDRDQVERHRKVTAIMQFNDSSNTKLKDVMAILQ